MICSNAFSIEKDVHSKFNDYRMFGEWLKVDPTEVINFLEQQTFVLKSEFMENISLMQQQRKAGNGLSFKTEKSLKRKCKPGMFIFERKV